MSGAASRRRKEPAPKQAPDLLVFGYEVRFFNHPTLAADIEAGRHLMPCQGREDLLVDRFDVRLILENLSQFERPPSSMPALSERERIEDAELDKFRYEDMEAAEARFLEEEERKRAAAGSGFHMVGFKYEAETKAADAAATATAEEPPVVPFAPPFGVLPGMLLPSTARVHSIIDTTAKFVHKQGEQAEVRLRLQHKDNPSFSFLLIDDPLHPYYKFVRTLIKEGVETSIPPPPPPLPVVVAPDSASTPSATSSAPTAAAPFPPAEPPLPPPDLKLIIDKLVDVVLKHGNAFEATVRQRESANPRFNFLQPGSEWHAYYRKKLELARKSPSTAATVTGLALLAAYSDEEDDVAPSPAAAPAHPPPPPPSSSSAPVPAPTSSGEDAAAKEVLRKQRLQKVKLLASKLSTTPAAVSTSPRRPRSPSPSEKTRDRSASPPRRAAS